MPLAQVTFFQILLLSVPLLCTLYAIYHVWKSSFDTEQEKLLWFGTITLFPVLGATLYVVFGLLRIKKNRRNNDK